MKREIPVQPRPLTLADICLAIADGKLPTTIEDGYYTVSRRELRGLRRATNTAARRPPAPRPTSIAS